MLLIDIGSTYTKLVAADTEAGEIIATAQAPTTIDDVSRGFHQALALLEAAGAPAALLEYKLASSSAAGGLRMAAVGLVPELTVEAAKMAALGAGAKVVGAFGFKLYCSQLTEIEACRPDIILLAGGTDGGESETILHNAAMLGKLKLDIPFIVCGNRAAAGGAAALLEDCGKSVCITDNVMPRIGKTAPDPVKKAIREIFIKRIVAAKGLDKINRYINGIALPTPLAVLEAAVSISEILGGGVVVVDVGGATTDVHSVCDGLPRDASTIVKGLPEPYVKRTVEGDLGVRHNIETIIGEVGPAAFLDRLNQNGALCSGPELEAIVRNWASCPESLPQNETEQAVDTLLASAAVDIALTRHAGHLEEYRISSERVFVQYGKDLGQVAALIGTGGPVINNPQPEDILRHGCRDPRDPFLLKPIRPRLYTDMQYILFSIGLIRQVDKQKSQKLAANYFRKTED